jgi:hypothetical protein
LANAQYITPKTTNPPTFVGMLNFDRRIADHSAPMAELLAQVFGKAPPVVVALRKSLTKGNSHAHHPATSVEPGGRSGRGVVESSLPQSNHHQIPGTKTAVPAEEPDAIRCFRPLLGNGSVCDLQAGKGPRCGSIFTSSFVSD